MNLQYHGVNKRGRSEWVELDLIATYRPEGLIMEEWQVNQYRPFVEGIRAAIGRELTKEELGTIAWLSGSEKDTISQVLGIIQEAYEHGKKSEEETA